MTNPYVAPRADTEHRTQLEAGNEKGIHFIEKSTDEGTTREWPLPFGDFHDNRWFTTTSSTTSTTSTSTSTSSTSSTTTTTSP